MGGTDYIPPIVQANVTTKARTPHRLLLTTFPGEERHVLLLLSQLADFHRKGIYGGFTCPNPGARPDVTLHSSSVIGRTFRQEAVAIKVAISFAYIHRRAFTGEIVVSTCQTRKLISLYPVTLFMLQHYVKTSVIYHMTHKNVNMHNYNY